MRNYWFIATKHNRRHTKLTLLTVVLAFFVIMLGAYTRLTDAGLSCPDWPNCYGFLTAPHTAQQLETASSLFPTSPINVTKAWTEMTHRYFAGAEGILIFLLSLSILMDRKFVDSKKNLISFVLITLLCLQVVLGMFTVTEKLKPMIVLAHLIIGLSLLTALWWVYLNLHLRTNRIRAKKARAYPLPWFWLAFIIIAIQIILGGMVATHYAGLACIDFPYCNGQLLPTIQWSHLETDLVSIHMLHRIGALITAIYLGFFSFFLLSDDNLKGNAWVILVLLGVQITLGIMNILWLRPVWLALSHQAVAIVLLLAISTLLIKASFLTENCYGTWHS